MSNDNTWTARRSIAALLSAAMLLGSSVARAQDGAVVVPPPPPPPPAPPAAPSGSGGWAPGGAGGWAPGAPPPQTPGYPRRGPLDGRAGRVKVTLESTEPGVRVELHHRRAEPEQSQPIVSCIDRCSVYVTPGRYKFYVVGDDDFLSGSREVTIDADVVLLIDPDTQAHRTIGLTLGIGGLFGLGVGVALILDAADKHSDSRAETGVWIALGSLVAIPVGWSVFGTSFKPEWEEHYLEDREAKALEPQWSVGVAPVNGGGVFGASLTF
ncbi:MAG: hypothetical protein KC766_40035 [Myxococcales bacterium]|nr:hypothetical protein [Myxococcales bacterium]